MNYPRLEIAIGVLDGINRSFYTPTAYQHGSIIVYWNALPTSSVETDPDSGRFELEEAPHPGDVLQVFYMDASPTGGLASQYVCRINAYLVDTQQETGAIQSNRILQANIDHDFSIGVSLRPVVLAGRLDPVGLAGRIGTCQ